MQQKKITILRSSDEEITYAVLECTTSHKMGDELLLDCFRKAITRWMDETEEGKKAWEESCEDFNVGDLVFHVDNNKELRDILESWGIYDVEIETFCIDSQASNAWTYDTVLRN